MNYMKHSRLTHPISIEPNNYLGFESCSVMFTGTGRWNDAYCSQPANGYVCKRPVNPGDLTTPKPTQMPEGHCAQSPLQSTPTFEFRGYCYKFSDFSGDTSLHRNWTEARSECKYDFIIQNRSCLGYFNFPHFSV